MPVYYGNKPNPKELRSFYNAQKRIAQLQLESNKQSGIIGTPKADSEGFDKLIKSFENVENQLEAYLPSIVKIVQLPERVTAGNTGELYIALNTANKMISRVTLNALPLTDIQTLTEYKNSFTDYTNTVSDFRDELARIQGALGRAGQDPQVFNKTEIDLENIRQKLSVLTQSIDAQITMYNSGVAQPVKLIGGCMCDLDEHLKYSPMYQNQPYIYPQIGGAIPTRYL